MGTRRRTRTRTRTSIGVLAAAFFLITARARTAHAEPQARFVYLRGKDTESCPSETDVHLAVQKRLGYDPFSTFAASTMFAEVTRSAAGTGFVASLKLVDGDNAVKGDRTLHVEGQCAELMDAMALTISIAIDPMSVTRNGPPPDAPPAEKPVDTTLPSADVATATTAPSPTPAEHPAPNAPAEELRLFADLGPVASLGAAPSLALGAVLGVSGQLGRLVGGVEGRADLPASAAAGSLGRVESSLVAASLFAGAREGPFYAAGVASIGRLAATSTNVETPNARSALFLGVGFRIGAALPLTDRIEARIRAEVLANLQRHTLTISAQEAYQYPVASGDLGLSIAVRFR